MAQVSVPKTDRVRTARPSADATARHKLTYCSTYICGDTVIVASSSIIGRFYAVTADGCPCEGARHGLRCWHTAARALVLAGVPSPIAAGPHTPDEIDAADTGRQLAAMRQAGALRASDKKADRIREHMATKTYTQADHDELFG